MEKVEVNKLECRYPSLFKVMWLAVVVWMVVSIANYFGHWLLFEKLDGFGMSALFLFGVAMICCFGKGFLNLLKENKILPVDSVTKKVVSYLYLAVFTLLLIISIWELCEATDNHTDFSMNGAVGAVPLDAVFDIVCDLINATVFTFVIVAFYWYIRICFVLFSGRIRRLGIEVALALLMLAYLSINTNDQLWVNATVLLIASSFLYDIWRFADFQEEKFRMSGSGSAEAASLTGSRP